MQHLGACPPAFSRITMADVDLTCEGAAGILMHLIQSRRESSAPPTGHHGIATDEEEAAWILVTMSQGRRDHNPGLSPTAQRLLLPASLAPLRAVNSNTITHPENNIIDSTCWETDSQETVEDLLTRADEMAPATRDQRAQKVQSERDGLLARANKSVKGQPPPKSPLSAKGKQPAENIIPAEKTQPGQRPSILDDPALVRRSDAIDKEIGFPGGPTKENSDEWLNKKIEFIQKQTQERNARS